MTFLYSPDTLLPTEQQPEALGSVAISEVNPLLPAETVALSNLQHYYDEVDQALVHLPARRLSAQTSHYIEVARSPETSNVLSTIYFDHATEAAEHITSKYPDAPYLEVIETSLLTTFIPAFRSLKSGVQLTSDVIGDIHEGLGFLMNEVENVPLAARNKAGFEAKLAILALGARLGTTEMLYFPPTIRESRNVGPHKRLNHSVYSMSDGQKRAARVRFSPKNTMHAPHPSILSLSFGGIVKQATRTLRRSAPTPQDVLEALRLEANGQSIGRRAVLLDELSDVVRTQMLYYDGANTDLL